MNNKISRGGFLSGFLIAMLGYDWRFVAAAIGIAVLAFVYAIPPLVNHYQNAYRAEYAATQEYELSKRIAPLAPTAESPTAEHIA